MAEMGTYCKAYPIEKFREFSAWSENAQNARKEKHLIDGHETEKARDLTGHLYLQENFTVTDDIFLDQNIIFDQVTPDWISFCKDTLQFAVPEYDSPSEDGQIEATGETSISQ